MNRLIRPATRPPRSSASKIPAIFTRHAHRHRTIQVQLTADVPGLGGFGSVQTVNPGRMRNQLYPLGLAAYIPRGAAPKLLERPRDSHAPLIDIDFAELELSLRELPELIFRRRAKKSEVGSSSTSYQDATPPKSRALYGSITPADVLQRLSDSHHLTLIPPHALLEFHEGTKLRSTGKYEAAVTLRNGVKIPLLITIEGDE